ncbi:MAG: beta-ketoacyl-ACP synthase II [Raoultibacter sp.]
MSTQKTAEVQRVVITGCGALSPAGFGVDALWEALMDARCCLGPLTRFDTEGFEVKIAGQIPGYDAEAAGFSKKEARRLGRFIQYAMVASDEAIAQSGLDLAAEDTTRIACVFGSGMGGIEVLERDHRAYFDRGPKRVSPLFIPQMISNMAAGNLAIRYGLRGECSSIVTACATGTHCIGEAYRLIRFGYADAALAGGTEESVTPMCIAGFGNLGALTKEADPTGASRPFDVRRSGFVAAEGAGALVLESLQHARARNAHIIAEITGFGSTGDAHHMTSPAPDGEAATRAMRDALAEGGFTPADLGHLNAHGTSTPVNDRTEAAALIGLCGQAGKEVPVVSVKGSIGHTLGAAGALEAIVCALSVARDTVPPTAGFAQADPDCPVTVLGEPRRNYPQAVALSTSLGFGGHNGALAFSPYRAGSEE